MTEKRIELLEAAGFNWRKRATRKEAATARGETAAAATSTVPLPRLRPRQRPRRMPPRSRGSPRGKPPQFPDEIRLRERPPLRLEGDEYNKRQQRAG
mmetsp:Transcript_3717/g.8371  ORF Transcript_3717/g.8371 Transcript_3717/m.8371 type:complete len:97 (-) Transcript_3717:232-522(-)